MENQSDYGHQYQYDPFNADPDYDPLHGERPQQPPPLMPCDCCICADREATKTGLRLDGGHTAAPTGLPTNRPSPTDEELEREAFLAAFEEIFQPSQEDQDWWAKVRNQNSPAAQEVKRLEQVRDEAVARYHQAKAEQAAPDWLDPLQVEINRLHGRGDAIGRLMSAHLVHLGRMLGACATTGAPLPAYDDLVARWEAVG